MLKLLLLSSALTLVTDNGQYENVPPNVRAWFQSVQSPSGVPCCNLANGHRTDWRGRSDGLYEVPIDGAWVTVPPKAVITNTKNPDGDAVVWYTKPGGHVYIRCFVPNGGV